jgi:hypothetical protein
VIALALGGASCLHADLAEAAKLVDPAACTIVACNDAGIDWPHHLDEWATMHAGEMELRKAKRAALGHPDGYRTWTRPHPFGMQDRDRMCDELLAGYSGSSGLLAVGVAIKTGHRRVMLCGIPMDTSEHYNRSGAWNAGPGYRPRWEEIGDHLRRYCRSFSGWTRDFLGGPPTAEWLGAPQHVGVGSAAGHN